MPNNDLTQAPSVDAKKVKQEVAASLGNDKIADSLLASFSKLEEQGQLVFPDNYPVGNQIKLMFTTIAQSGVLAKVTTDSVGQALAEAIIQGLEIDKHQVYFIARGNQLKMFRSYYGDVKVAKETELVKDIFARPIYEDDTYEEVVDEQGLMAVANHKTALLNQDKGIIGGYAWAVMKDGTKRYCIMTRKEIDAAWNKSSDPSRNVQKDFPQEMAKRTTIRRLVKMIFNTAPSNISDKAKAIISSYNKTTADEYDNDKAEPIKKSSVKNVLCDDNGSPIETEVKSVE